ncbi:MAG TPA: glucokinase [Gammaproteobacteria bacterium]
MQVHETLSADIGGTHARFMRGAATSGSAPIELASGDYPDIDALIRAGLAKLGMDPRGNDAVLSLAGPVRLGRMRFTNLDWGIDAEVLKQHFGFRHVALLNDLEAAAWALAESPPRPSLVLRDAEAAPGARHAVISVSTGLGTAYWSRVHGHLEVQAAEAGHAGFAASADWQLELLEALQNRYGERVSWERVLSGSGLSFLEGHLRGGEPTQSSDVVRRARSGEVAAVTAVQRFSHLMGVFAGDIALAAPVTGGIWFMGGVLAGLGDLLDRTRFLEGFDAKGRLSAQVRGLSLRTTSEDFLGIRGAWYASRTLFKQA